MKLPINLAVFASGSGSNATKIVEHFDNKAFANISLLVCNNTNAGILKNKAVNHINRVVIGISTLKDEVEMKRILNFHDIQFIVLAGFLLKIPPFIIAQFPNRIVNIHPALLPKYGGKGMYGHQVHEAVYNNGDELSGMTVHFVNENYDEGDIIFQASCNVKDAGTPLEIGRRVLKLEHQYYAQIIEELILQLT